MAWTSSELLEASREGRLALLDIRPGHAYTEGHVAGAVSAAFGHPAWGPSVAKWLTSQSIGAAAILCKVAADGEAARSLLEREEITVSAVVDGGPTAWSAGGLPVVAVANLTADELATHLPDWTVIDVREPYEWRTGVVPGALTVPMGQIVARAETLDHAKRYAIICASGNRSQAAAAYLADQGFTVANVRGGMALWLGGRHPVEQPRP
jgi:rhodanese-related sulfurtransferase